VYDRILHLKIAHDIWLKLCNTYEGSSEIKSSHKNTYNKQYQTFSQKPRESFDDCFARFESIMSNLRACGPLAYTDNERAKQLLYTLDDHVWGMKITNLKEFADFVTLDTEKLFSKLKSHELSHKGSPNHDASFTSKTLITSAHVSSHDANPTNTISSSLEFALSSLTAACDEKYESIPNDEIVLLARKFRALHKFRKEKRRSPRGCFECSDTTHFIVDCPKRKKFDSFNKYNYANWNDSSNKGDNKTKNRFGDKKKKFQKIMSQACAVLSDFNFSSEDSSSLEEDEKFKCKKDDFTGLCLMSKSSLNDSDFDISDDLSFESLSSKVIELENALCNQDKLLCKVFRKNKKLNLELENSFVEIASLWLMHADMSAQPCDNCSMIMVNYADLWIAHTQVTSQFKGAKLELKELKTRSLLLGAYLECSKLKLELDAHSLKVKDLETKLLEKPDVSVTLSPCKVCDTLKDKLFHAIKENTELKQEVTYLSAHLERTKVSEKMIEYDFS
jgi:hypothetical protein